MVLLSRKNLKVAAHAGRLWVRVSRAPGRTHSQGANDAIELAKLIHDELACGRHKKIIIDQRESPTIIGPTTQAALRNVCRDVRRHDGRLAAILPRQSILHGQMLAIVEAVDPESLKLVPSPADAIAWVDGDDEGDG